VEESFCGGRAEGSGGSLEAADVVVGGEVVRSCGAIGLGTVGHESVGGRHGGRRICASTKTHSISEEERQRGDLRWKLRGSQVDEESDWEFQGDCGHKLT